MPDNPAKFVSTILASVLAGAVLATMPHGAARAADDCLSAPKDDTPAGKHWYYRIDHASKRHCWYLRGEGEKLSQAPAPQADAPDAAPPVAPKAAAAPPRSLADARAELPAQTPMESPRSRVVPPAPVAANTPNAPENNIGLADESGPAAARSIVASRWPDLADAAPSPDPAPADAGTRANPPTQPPSVLAASPLAAADASSQPRFYSVPMQLAALLGALALAAMIGSVIFKLAGARRLRQARMRARRGPIWEATDDDSIRLSPEANAMPRRAGFGREPDPGAARNERISEFFSQLAKRGSS